MDACPDGFSIGMINPPNFDGGSLPPLKVRDLRLEVEQKYQFFKGLATLKVKRNRFCLKD